MLKLVKKFAERHTKIYMIKQLEDVALMRGVWSGNVGYSFSKKIYNIRKMLDPNRPSIPLSPLEDFSKEIT